MTSPHSSSVPTASSASVPTGRGEVLVLRDIRKTFPGVVANDGVTFDVRAGEVHALLGENGAGKTTLMSILYGTYQPDAGEIVVRGRPVRIRSPRDALGMGIGMVPQHFLLVRPHTVAENIVLGLPEEEFLFPARRAEQRINEIGGRYGLRVDPRARVWELSPSEQQRVEILKALIRGAQILILDEPTSVLTPQEAAGLFEVIRRMCGDGCSVIFISHKLDEVNAIADRVTILRKGRVIATYPVAGTDKRTLARTMVGRDVAFELERDAHAPRDEGLVIDGLEAAGDRGVPALRGISLEARRGEIVGVAGIAGNGQRELVEVLSGLRPATAGRVVLCGTDITNRSARTVHEAGVAHIPEDRLRMGIVPAMSVAENLVLKRYRYPPFARGAVIDRQAVTEFARRTILEYDIATPTPETPARLLSGGNIQKLILGRELSNHPRVIIASHPTSGLDVSATEQIHGQLLRRRSEGAAVLLLSEDLDEILTLSDRIVVLFGGRIFGAVAGHAGEVGAARERIGLMMMGQHA